MTDDSPKENAANLHGDVAFTLDLSTPGTTPQAYYDYDEYGNPVVGNPGRYGWLGAKQRSTETLDGLTLMGVRLYTPTLGRFLTTDPVDGGSCNTYDYTCSDPLNKFDLSGKCWQVWKSECASQQKWSDYPMAMVRSLITVTGVGYAAKRAKFGYDMFQRFRRAGNASAFIKWGLQKCTKGWKQFAGCAGAATGVSEVLGDVGTIMKLHYGTNLAIGPWLGCRYKAGINAAWNSRRGVIGRYKDGYRAANNACRWGGPKW